MQVTAERLYLTASLSKALCNLLLQAAMHVFEMKHATLSVPAPRLDVCCFSPAENGC